MLRCSQNAFARKIGVDQSMLSRVMAGLVTSAPVEKRARSYIKRLRRRVVAQEASA